VSRGRVGVATICSSVIYMLALLLFGWAPGPICPKHKYGYMGAVRHTPKSQNQRVIVAGAQQQLACGRSKQTMPPRDLNLEISIHLITANSFDRITVLKLAIDLSDKMFFQSQHFGLLKLHSIVGDETNTVG